MCWAPVPMLARPRSRKLSMACVRAGIRTFATSAADRRLREQRTKQINVAWEILSGKRPAGVNIVR